jgi:peptidyl-prolyl cis-trans isomerase C
MTISGKMTVLAFAGALATAALAADSAEVVKVNGKAIPQSRMDFAIKANAAQGQPDTPEVRSRIREILINNELIAQEALKKGLDKNPDVAMQIELNRQQVLVNAYVQDYLKNHTISEEAMKKEYESAKAQAPDKEYKARHILVKTEDEAKQVIAQLKKGGSFEKLAAQKSEDSGSKERGGDLDWAPAARYVPAFGEALKKMKKGQLTDTPVQTTFGWHVIRLDDERPTKIPPYEEVKNNVRQRMQQQAVQNAINDLRAKAKIE